MRRWRGGMREARRRNEEEVRVWRKRRQTERQRTISRRARWEKISRSNSKGSSMIGLELTMDSGADSDPRSVSISPRPTLE
ncbi:hypothetical protein AAC387_Pa02g1723 [Persea americana]